MKITYPSTPAALAAVSVLALCLTVDTQAADVDADAAQAFAKQNNCFKCHGIDKDKVGTAWNKISNKFKALPDAEAKLVEHLHTGNKVKDVDGNEIDHPVLKSDDAAATKNLVDWILSL